MGKQKVFWVSFACTLAALLPLYAIIYFTKTLPAAHSAPAGAANSNIAVDKPQTGDSKNLFLVIKGDVPQFLMVRFDAFQGRVSVTALQNDTLLRASSGGVVTLKDAWDYAGPGYAAQLTADTLGITMNNYLQMTAESAVRFCGKIGAVRLDGETLDLAGAGAVETNSKDAALSAQNIADLLRLTKLSESQRTPFLARVAALFFAAGADRLGTLFPELLRADEQGLATDIFATEIYEYARILGYFVTTPPKTEYFVFEGTETETGFELAESVPATAQRYFT